MSNLENGSGQGRTMVWLIGIMAATFACEWASQAWVLATFSKGLQPVVGFLTPLILGIASTCCLFYFCGQATNLFFKMPRSFWRFAACVSYQSVLSGLVVAAASVATTAANHYFGYAAVKDILLIAGAGGAAALVNLIAGGILFKSFGDL